LFLKKVEDQGFAAYAKNLGRRERHDLNEVTCLGSRGRKQDAADEVYLVGRAPTLNLLVLQISLLRELSFSPSLLVSDELAVDLRFRE
jgi:hypothetical protein